MGCICGMAWMWHMCISAHSLLQKNSGNWPLWFEQYSFSHLFFFKKISFILQSYASILYLRLPPRFRIVLRGKDVVHHNIVNDMMLIQEVTYRPHPGADGAPKDSNVIFIVKCCFFIFLSNSLFIGNNISSLPFSHRYINLNVSYCFL